MSSDINIVVTANDKSFEEFNKDLAETLRVLRAAEKIVRKNPILKLINRILLLKH
jgi:hypothetical protein